MATMEVLKQLTHPVAMAFYESRHVVLMDAMAREHGSKKEDVLAVRLKFGLKSVRRLLSQLRQDGIVRSEARSFSRGPDRTAGTVLCWFIDYPHLIRVIRFKLYKIRHMLHEDTRRVTENKEYI